MILKWSITEMNAIEGVIKSVKYLAELSEGDKTVAYVQQFRITKGYARYTANFTAPTAAFPIQ
jgi:hypothetical protein